METILYILLALSIWHFFYESVLAPSLRHGLRYKFFELRDRLRDIKMEGLSNKDEKLYESLDSSICNLINSMSFISLGNYYLLKKEYESNGKSLKESQMKDVIEDTENRALIEIDDSIIKLGVKALFINNGAVFIYLTPLFLVVVIASTFGSQLDKLWNKAEGITNDLIYSSDGIPKNPIAVV